MGRNSLVIENGTEVIVEDFFEGESESVGVVLDHVECLHQYYIDFDPANDYRGNMAFYVNDLKVKPLRAERH